MSLLDLTNDPQRMGLLSLGLRLMQTPGKFGAALGSAGMGALSDMQAAQDRQAQGKEREQAQRMRAMQEQALQLQLAQTLQEQKRRQGVEEAYRGAMVSPATQALAGGGGPTVQNAAAMQGLTPKLDQGRLLQGLSSVDPMMAAQMLQPKPSDYKVVGGSLVEVGPGGVREAYRAPDAAGDKDLALLELIHGKGTPAFFAAAQQLANKRTTHAPAASAVSYGSPVPVMLPDGSVGYAQPANKPGAQPQVMSDPTTGKPMVRPGEADKALTEGQAKALAFASRMQSADQMLAQLSRGGTTTTIPGAMQNSVVGSAITAASSAKQQQLGQAKRDFINAALRRESGAVIGADEFANAERQYFPQIGDSREVVEQKARNRRTAIEGVKADVPTGKRGEVDRIANPVMDKDDPLGLRK